MVTIRKVGFPLSLSVEQKEAVVKLPGRDVFGHFFPAGDPFLRGSWKLWIEGDTELMFLCCCFWKDEISELESSRYRVNITEKREGYSVLVGSKGSIEQWDQQLREIGALSIEDEKLELRKLTAFE
jgi:hypothetical protein